MKEPQRVPLRGYGARTASEPRLTTRLKEVVDRREPKLSKAGATVQELVDMIERGQLRLPEMQQQNQWFELVMDTQTYLKEV